MSASRLLLIDDDRNLTAQLRDLLAFEGYDVQVAHSGEEGLTRLGSASFDLIILDVNMPGIGGIGFLRRVAELGSARPPIVAFTARANMGGFFQGLDVAAYLTKPCDVETLLRTVAAHVRRAEAQPAVPAVPVTRRVLVAEDDPATARSLQAALKAAGYETRLCATGSGSVEDAIVFKPDVVVVKRILTGLNGDKVIAVLRHLPATERTRYILYDDAVTLDAAEERYLNSHTGIHAFLRTHTPAEVTAAVQRVLSI